MALAGEWEERVCRKNLEKETAEESRRWRWQANLKKESAEERRCEIKASELSATGT